jgi:hypothetical protein
VFLFLLILPVFWLVLLFILVKDGDKALISLALIFLSLTLFGFYYAQYSGGTGKLIGLLLGPLGGIIGLFDLISRSSYIGILSTIISFLLAYLFAQFLFNKYRGAEFIIIIFAIVGFWVSLPFVAQIIVNFELNSAAKKQFGNQYCEMHISSVPQMVEYGLSEFSFGQHATILTPKGGYNWSFKQGRWTFDTYTGDSAGSEKIFEKTANDIFEFNKCIKSKTK